jgi:peptidoglycan-N-acetylglucosamine deacetylase
MIAFMVYSLCEIICNFYAVLFYHILKIFIKLLYYITISLLISCTALGEYMYRFLEIFLKIIVVLFLNFVIFKAFQYLKSPLSPQLFGEAIWHIKTDEKVVALTFDDGTHPLYTDQILDVLKEHGVPATFFVIGEHVQEYPVPLKRVIAEHHEIGNHSWSHQSLIFKTPAYIYDEILRTDALIRELGYKGEIYFRAPYGRKLFLLPWILSSLNRKHILFDIQPHGWSNPGVDVIVEHVLSRVKNGSIILLHDGGGNRQQTVIATKRIIEHLKKQGYRFLTISELLLLRY